MRALDLVSLPICGSDNRLEGMLTDRDIVVECIARGGDPGSTKVSQLAQGRAGHHRRDDSIDEARP